MLTGELFRPVFPRSEQKAESFAATPGVFAVVNIMRTDHTLQISTLFLRPPVDSLMNNDVMENNVKDPVTKNPNPYSNHVGIVVHLCKVVKDPNARQAEYEGEQVILLKLMMVNAMM
ncbi:MAG TPA: hypothetical protein VIQ51_10990 [Chryseosolibacter sp.]